MSSELEKSGYSAQLLEESSEGLAQISTAYASFGALLHDSIDLIRQMERAELWDYAVLVASLSFFVGCVAYILYVRVLSRGLSLVSLAWRATSLVRRSPVPSAVAAASAHTSSLAAAAAAASASALRRSPAGAPRKVLHRDDPVADATRHLADTPRRPRAAWAPSRAAGAMRGVEARRNAEAFRDAEEQAHAMAERALESEAPSTSRARAAHESDLIQSIEARFSESPPEALFDLPIKTSEHAPPPRAKKPRRKMGTMESVPSASTSTSVARAATATPDVPSRVEADESPAEEAPEAVPRPRRAPPTYHGATTRRPTRCRSRCLGRATRRGWRSPRPPPRRRPPAGRGRRRAGFGARA
ncbi:SEC20 [Malassezia furfur]|nr:SEC20 [Malassezia furfur]